MCLLPAGPPAQSCFRLFGSWGLLPRVCNQAKRKKKWRREGIALIFSNWVFIVVESYLSDFLLENSLKKKT